MLFLNFIFYYIYTSICLKLIEFYFYFFDNIFLLKKTIKQNIFFFKKKEKNQIVILIESYFIQTDIFDGTFPSYTTGKGRYFIKDQRIKVSNVSQLNCVYIYVYILFHILTNCVTFFFLQQIFVFIKMFSITIYCCFLKKIRKMCFRTNIAHIYIFIIICQSFFCFLFKLILQLAI